MIFSGLATSTIRRTISFNFRWPTVFFRFTSADLLIQHHSIFVRRIGKASDYISCLFKLFFPCNPDINGIVQIAAFGSATLGTRTIIASHAECVHHHGLEAAFSLTRNPIRRRLSDGGHKFSNRIKHDLKLSALCRILAALSRASAESKRQPRGSNDPLFNFIMRP